MSGTGPIQTCQQRPSASADALWALSIKGFRGGRRKNRTFNKRIKSPLLCQLSYAPGLFNFQSLSFAVLPSAVRPR
jgi:hypothetical protein